MTGGNRAGARRTTAALALVTLATALLYFGPEYWYRRPLPEGQISMVATIESWGPIWPGVFLTAALSLFWCLWRNCHMALAHSIAVGVWIFYATTLILSAAYSEPPGPILAATLGYGLAGVHLAMIRVWADLGVK
ncbi:hypothetical protein P9990_17505 [Prescottella equi]|uniref:hypothetical protein n=1 Tax=Rhodococcus hoagii TaxID=43767 RepID=UPI0025780643|nr:hypothetical protein [Prescottella equi]WJJ10368.1 hypothetical protein P9990_17505 [Prescottella equi]